MEDFTASDNGEYGQQDQLELSLEIRPYRLVSWFNAIATEKKRIFWKNRRIVRLISDESGWPQFTRFPVDNISKLEDPDLRYALRFADAAEAVGWASDGFGQSGHRVSIDATDEGLQSKLLTANYTGVISKGTDTFLESLMQANEGNQNK